MSVVHDVVHVFSAMQHHPELATMTYLNLHTFIRCASHLKDDILQPQPHTVFVIVAPAVLPLSITGILASVSVPPALPMPSSGRVSPDITHIYQITCPSTGVVMIT
ncbi:hypothetical protein PAXINDRAFT_21371 [Paxillus involutus ATCC 200175]|uniref:Uncharacterized protein n=1 Tax=Paxillus involutus ATCC 200175 TaxID=664439 RepID=A0A0C9STD4_PAXIN|nr:hypothetical protein PAXINDRAFT_21371 [Paxillus involutus ATCC 200175]